MLLDPDNSSCDEIRQWLADNLFQGVLLPAFMLCFTHSWLIDNSNCVHWSHRRHGADDQSAPQEPRLQYAVRMPPCVTRGARLTAAAMRSNKGRAESADRPPREIDLVLSEVELPNTSGSALLGEQS